MVATGAVKEQKAQIERRWNRDISRDAALRFAIDDFVVGYAVGVATQHVLINGRQPNKIPMKSLLSELESRLSGDFPNLDFGSTYRGGSVRLSCGIFLGLREVGEERKAFHWGVNAMSPLTLGPEIMMMQFAHERCGASPVEGEIVYRAIGEMRGRYNQ
jgi:hypothetical protein